MSGEAAVIYGTASSRRKATLVVLALSCGLIIGTAVVVMGVGFACPNASFCFIAKSVEVTTNSPSTTVVATTVATTTVATTTPKSTRVPIGPGDDYCYMRKEGICVTNLQSCPDFLTKAVDGCKSTGKCCVSPKTKKVDTSGLPKRENCGQIPGLRFRLSRSFETIQWPFMAALMKGGKIFCGATIISPTYLLTVASCVSGKLAKDISAITGSLNIVDLGPNAKTYNVKTITMHPDYMASTKANNIALLELTEFITMDMWRQPACLPVAGDKFITQSDPQYKPDVCLMLGWGPTIFDKDNKKLQTSPTLLITDEKCKELIAKCDQTFLSYLVPKITCNYIVLNGLYPPDYGGPVLCPINQRYVLEGALSFANPEVGQANCAIIAVEIQQYVDWIKNIAKDVPAN